METSLSPYRSSANSPPTSASTSDRASRKGNPTKQAYRLLSLDYALNRKPDPMNSQSLLATPSVTSRWWTVSMLVQLAQQVETLNRDMPNWRVALAGR